MIKNKGESEEDIILKPCPFCGGTVLEVTSNGIFCPCGGGFIHPNDEDPVEGWNKRHTIIKSSPFKV